MEYIYLILGILSLFFIGYAPVYFLLPGRGGFKIGSRSISGNLFIFSVSFFVGALMAGWLMTVFSLADVSFGGQVVYGVSAVFFVFYIYNYMSVKFRSSERKSISRLARDMITARERSRLKVKVNTKRESNTRDKTLRYKAAKTGKPFESRISRILFGILIAFVIINFLVVIFFTIIFPIRFWDAISCWSLKGKAFFLDGIINNFYTHDYSFSHPSYPLYLPLTQTWLFTWMGETSENLVKIIFPIFYGTLMILLFYLFRQKLSKLISITLVFIISVLPIIVDHGYIEYTNLLFSVVMLLAVYFFYLAKVTKDKTTFFILSAIFFAILALVRSEGIIYAALFLVMDFFFSLWALLHKKKPLKSLLNFLMPLAVFIIFLVPWYLLKLKLGLPFISVEWTEFIRGNTVMSSGSFDFGRGAAVLGQQLLLSVYDSTRAVFSSFYGPVWVLMLVAMLSGLRDHFKDYGWIFFSFLALGMASIFISLSSVEDFANSTERYILHLFPLAYYWVMTNSAGRLFKRKGGRVKWSGG